MLDWYELLKHDGIVKVHRTYSKENAEDILLNGFFLSEDDLYKTTDEITLDEIHIDWILTLRKSYGDFLIIIHLKKEHFNEYEYFKEPIIKNDISLICKVPSKFIKGYVNLKTNEYKININYKL